MTGYTVHTGSNDKFASGWDQIFTKPAKPAKADKAKSEAKSKKKAKKAARKAKHGK